MKYLFWSFGVFWLALFILFVVGKFEPDNIVVGCAMLGSSIAMALAATNQGES